MDNIFTKIVYITEYRYDICCTHYEFDFNFITLLDVHTII